MAHVGFGVVQALCTDGRLKVSQINAKPHIQPSGV